MVDTLVLGTSANAWEFESLHAQLFFIYVSAIEIFITYIWIIMKIEKNKEY